MARPKVLVLQHVPYEPLGTLDPLLKDAGFRIRYVNFEREPDSRPTLDGYEALIVLGGPMNSDQIDSHPNLITEVEIIREAVDCDLSVLGICLGAHAYGLQFHLEANGPLIERWLTLPAHQETLREEEATVDPERIRRQAETSVGRLEKLSRETFSRWIDRFEIGPRKQRLPSR